MKFSLGLVLKENYTDVEIMYLVLDKDEQGWYFGIMFEPALTDKSTVPSRLFQVFVKQLLPHVRAGDMLDLGHKFHDRSEEAGFDFYETEIPGLFKAYRLRTT